MGLFSKKKKLSADVFIGSLINWTLECMKNHVIGFNKVLKEHDLEVKPDNNQKLELLAMGITAMTKSVTSRDVSESLKEFIMQKYTREVIEKANIDIDKKEKMELIHKRLNEYYKVMNESKEELVVMHLGRAFNKYYLKNDEYADDAIINTAFGGVFTNDIIGITDLINETFNKFEISLDK